MLRALAIAEPVSTSTSARNRRAAPARAAAGRAWSPSRRRTLTSRVFSPSAGPEGTPALGASLRTRRSSTPAVTNPVAALIPSTRSRLVTTTGVTRLRAERATRSASKARSTSPVTTRLPCATRGTKPRPPSATVSRPTCASPPRPSRS